MKLLDDPRLSRPIQEVIESGLGCYFLIPGVNGINGISLSRPCTRTVQMGDIMTVSADSHPVTGKPPQISVTEGFATLFVLLHVLVEISQQLIYCIYYDRLRKQHFPP